MDLNFIEFSKFVFFQGRVFLDKACASFKSNLFAAAMDGQPTSDSTDMFGCYLPKN